MLEMFIKFCYNNYVHEQNLIEQTVLSAVFSGRKVKGKQVKLLHDLVTVIA